MSSSAGQLVAGQTSAVLRTITTGDSYMPTLAAFQIDVNAPNLRTWLISLATSRFASLAPRLLLERP